ncbi:MAG: hypothetical protein HY315_01815, partial [Acidobacteria bacterium]|nr:hypothetical protein [Acidobacteriota bacterium]
LFLGEFELETAQAVSRQAVFRPLSRYPGVFRDFSFLVDRRVAFDALAGFVSALAAPHLSRMELIDLYDSPQLPPGKTSLAVRFFFESAERTLTDEEIEAARDRIVQSLQSKFGVIPR